MAGQMRYLVMRINVVHGHDWRETSSAGGAYSAVGAVTGARAARGRSLRDRSLTQKRKKKKGRKG